jgi:predicted kinase
MATLYLTFGPTHSGKTTFGEKLYDKLIDTSKTILVDNDTVEAFVKENFNNLRTDKDILRTRTPENPDLRLRIPQLIVDYALAESYNVIVTASHSKEAIRMKYYEIAQKHHAKVALLILTTSKDEILRRIQQAKRDNNILLKSKSFKEVLAWQEIGLHPPSENERKKYDQVFEINEKNTADTLKLLAPAEPTSNISE